MQWYVARGNLTMSRERVRAISKALMYSPMRKIIATSGAPGGLPSGLRCLDMCSCSPCMIRRHGTRSVRLMACKKSLTPVGESKIGVPWCCPVEDIDHLRRPEIRGEWDEMKGVSRRDDQAAAQASPPRKDQGC